MKTIEEKAEAYDMAIERARKLKEDPQGVFYEYSPKERDTICDYIFPELKESEDGLTWLTRYIEEEAYSLSMDIRDNEDRIKLEKFKKSLAWLEKQCKKPVDKVEPKFKVGDWCIDNEDGLIFQIVKVLDNTYRYRTNEGKEYSCSHYSLELDARFWTISDAKDGDVLYTPKGAGAEGIFLIKGWEQVECIGKTLCSRIGYRVKDDEVVAGGLGAIWWEGVIDPFYPATKEQRDLLFQKMKEAGYKKDLSNFG